MLGDPIDVEWFDICTYLGGFSIQDINRKELTHVRSRGFYISIDNCYGVEVLRLAASRHLEEEGEYVDISVIPTSVIKSVTRNA